MTANNHFFPFRRSRRWPDAHAMFKIIDGFQIFHVISKIKSSNYRAHAYIFNSTQKGVKLNCIGEREIGMNFNGSKFTTNSLSRLRLPKFCQITAIEPAQYLSFNVNSSIVVRKHQYKGRLTSLPNESIKPQDRNHKKSRHSIEDLSQLTRNINHNLDMLEISQFPEYTNGEKTKQKICKFFVLCAAVLAS